MYPSHRLQLAVPVVYHPELGPFDFESPYRLAGDACNALSPVSADPGKYTRFA